MSVDAVYHIYLYLYSAEDLLIKDLLIFPLGAIGNVFS